MMLRLSETELYSTKSGTLKAAIDRNYNGKLIQNIGVINPTQIEGPLNELKKYAKAKSASSPCLLAAIDFYENYGKIQLFDLCTPTSGRSDIPPSVPLLPGIARRDGVMGHPTTAIYVNMYRMGNWSLDEKEYENVIPITDLHACLESAFVTYEMIMDKKEDAVLSNGVVLDTLTNIYTSMFYTALIGVPGNLPIDEDFKKDAARYIIAKFFLTYVVRLANIDQINAIAGKVQGGNTSLQALKSFEDRLGIDYSKLSSFLATFGTQFFNGHATSIVDFERSWLRIYGEGMTYAVEYIPYLLHFLFASVVHSSRLGGSSNLAKKVPMLTQDGIWKLYNAVMAGVMK